MEGTQFIHKFPIFDGNGDGYQWLILAEQFWNAQGTTDDQGTTDEQRFLEVENGLAGKRRNPDADRTVFDIAFMHRYQPDSRPILPPEISWNEVSDLDVTLEEIRASLENFLSKQKSQQKRITDEEDPDFKLQLQPQIDPEVTKHEIAISNSTTTDHKFNFTIHKSTGPEYEIDEDAKLDKNLDLHLECTDRELTDAAKEEEEAISSSDASKSYSDTRSTANSVAKVNAIAKEEGDDNDSSNTKVCVAEKEEHPDRVVANLDVEIPLSERGTSDSSGVMEVEKRRTTIRVDGATVVGNDE
ncbi:hypothetical protein PIB30_035255 [Stylosanthes scabra]|uniref:Uncharacterized protein n=1 Tax=Stylosanthes scabra TaxID=79078 RepID=A0ABU6VBP4_9FABA|nr:hypothetical protein [Stylosanthes scabra]